MAAPSLVPALNSASRRSLPRYPINVSLDVIALQSGIPHNMPGRCCDLNEAGLGAVVAGELVAGQSVALEMRLPNVGLPVRARAQVRYHERLHCGLQFVGLSVEQREKIRYWASQNAARPIPAEIVRVEIPAADPPPQAAVPGVVRNVVPNNERITRRFRVRRRRFFVMVAFMIGLGGFGWWQWQQAWNRLEVDATLNAEPQPGLPLRVSPETMDRQIIYKVDPVYPDAARQAGLQGLVVLDAVIAPDGTVERLHPVAGPEVLSQSALDAVQSWKYTPYRNGGQAVEVETTVSVDFRLH
jgi:TonB family protein